MRYLRFIFLITLLPFFSYAQNYESVDNEYIVQMDEGQLLPFLDSLDPFFLCRFKSRLIPDFDYWLIRCDCSSDKADSLAYIFSKNEKIKSFQKNKTVLLRSTIPNDPLFPNQWQYINTGQSGGITDIDIDADSAWSLGSGANTILGDSIVIAIIDDGINVLHPDLKDQIWINRDEIPSNGIDDDQNGYTDDYWGWNTNLLNDNIGSNGAGGHGTPVSGICAARGNNNLGVTGINWNVKILLIRNNFNTSEANVIAAYGYALKQKIDYLQSYGKKGAFIVATNASWGINNGQASSSPLWCSFYDTLAAYGIINVASTTNNALDIDIMGDLPTTCPSEHLISVTNINKFGLLSGGYGRQNVDLAAPGDGIFTCSFSNYGSFGGTSAAAPHVSGAIALAFNQLCIQQLQFYYQYPKLFQIYLKSKLLQTVKPLSSLQNLSQSGGLLNLNQFIRQIKDSCKIDSCFVPILRSSEILTNNQSLFCFAYEADSMEIELWQGSQLISSFFTQNDSVLFTNLNSCQNYRCRYRSSCTGTNSAWSEIQFLTLNCCEIPRFISNQSISSFSHSINWQNQSNPIQVWWRKSGQAQWNIINTNSTNYLLSNLLPCSSYEFKVRTNCDSTYSLFSPVFTFYTDGCNECAAPNYCNMRGIQSQFDFIRSIQIDTFQYLSQSNSYLFHNTNQLRLRAGRSYPVEIKQGNVYQQNLRIWADFNNDLDFNDWNELLLQSSFNDSVLQTAIYIPEDVQTINSVLRVSLRYAAFPTLCSVIDNGETEDICIQLLPYTSVLEDNRSSYKLKIYPNPTKDVLYLAQELPENFQLKVTNVLGVDCTPSVDLISRQQMSVRSLEKGFYFLTVYINGNKHSCSFVIEN
jgi:serine protease